MKPIEQWKDLKGTPPWLWASVRTREPAGKEMTEEQYEQLCKELQCLPIGPQPPQEEE